MIGVSEAMSLGVKLGIDAKVLAGIFNTSSGRCWSSDTYNPVPGVMEVYIAIAVLIVLLPLFPPIYTYFKFLLFVRPQAMIDDGILYSNISIRTFPLLATMRVALQLT